MDRRASSPNSQTGKAKKNAGKEQQRWNICEIQAPGVVHDFARGPWSHVNFVAERLITHHLSLMTHHGVRIPWIPQNTPTNNNQATNKKNALATLSEIR